MGFLNIFKTHKVDNKVLIQTEQIETQPVWMVKYFAVDISTDATYTNGTFKYKAFKSETDADKFIASLQMAYSLIVKNNINIELFRKWEE